jgi:type IV pilus assembly protein PilF
VAVLGLGLELCGCLGDSGQGAADPDRMSVAEYDLARDSFGRTRYREALEHVAKALTLKADNAEAAYLGAVILLGFCAQDEHTPDCRYAEAERYARQALKAAPEMRDAKNTLGVVLINQKRYNEAIAVLEPLANDIIYGSPERAWGNLGLAYLESGKPDQAIEALNRAVAAQPNYCVGFYQLGRAYQAKGQHASAREAFDRALGIKAGDCGRLQDAFLARAESLKALGLGDEARSDLQQCRDLAPHTAAGKKCAKTLESSQ